MSRCLLLPLSTFLLSHCAAPVLVATLPPQLCFVDEIAPNVKVDLMYSGSDNFVGRPIAGYSGKRAVLRYDTAAALKLASEEFASMGYCVLLKDAYRPCRALDDIFAWSLTDNHRMQSRYYPRISKSRIHADKYIGKVSEHSWGVAMDITLLDARTGQELDLGGRVDMLDDMSATEYQGSLISKQAHENRMMLRSVMAKFGFRNYSKEWWHYWLSPVENPIMSYDFALDDSMQSAPFSNRY